MAAKVYMHICIRMSIHICVTRIQDYSKIILYILAAAPLGERLAMYPGLATIVRESAVKGFTVWVVTIG